MPQITIFLHPGGCPNIARFTWAALSFTSHCIINFDSQYFYKLKPKALCLLHGAIFHTKTSKCGCDF